MKVSVDGGQTWVDVDEVRIEHEVFVGEMNGYLYLINTTEGLIEDLYRRDVDANVATSSEGVQEMADRLLNDTPQPNRDYSHVFNA
jgi:hypothetical protein